MLAGCTAPGPVALLRGQTTNSDSPSVNSLTAKDVKAAKEQKSLNTKDSKDTKEQNSLNAKDTKDAK